MSKVVTVYNTANAPLPIEMRIEAAEFTQDNLKGTGIDPGDLVAFPHQALIQPGRAQTFRIQYVGSPKLTTSRHYYVTVAQLPAARPDNSSAIQLLYNFQVLVSVQPTGAKPMIKVTQAQLTTHDGKSALTMEVVNSGNGYGYFSQGNLLVVEKDASGKEVARRTYAAPEIQQRIGYGLLQSGQTRKVVMPLAEAASGVSVDVRFLPLANAR